MAGALGISLPARGSAPCSTSGRTPIVTASLSGQLQNWSLAVNSLLLCHWAYCRPASRRPADKRCVVFAVHITVACESLAPIVARCCSLMILDCSTGCASNLDKMLILARFLALCTSLVGDSCNKYVFGSVGSSRAVRRRVNVQCCAPSDNTSNHNLSSKQPLDSIDYEWRVSQLIIRAVNVPHCAFGESSCCPLSLQCCHLYTHSVVILTIGTKSRQDQDLFL